MTVPKLLIINKMLLNSYFTRSEDESLPHLIFRAARFLQFLLNDCMIPEKVDEAIEDCGMLDKASSCPINLKK